MGAGLGQAWGPEEMEEAFSKQRLFTARSQKHTAVKCLHVQKQTLVEDI